MQLRQRGEILTSEEVFVRVDEVGCGFAEGQSEGPVGLFVPVDRVVHGDVKLQTLTFQQVPVLEITNSHAFLWRI